MRVANLAIRQRTARLHCDFPEQDFAETVKNLLDIICLADRNATAGNDYVSRLRGLFECQLDMIRRVANDAHVQQFATQALQQPINRVTVTVIDLSRAKGLANRNQLVASREECHAQFSIDGDFTYAEGGHHAEFRWPHRLAALERYCTRAQIFSGTPRIGSFFWHRG